VFDKSVESLSAATAPLCHPGQNIRGNRRLRGSSADPLLICDERECDVIVILQFRVGSRRERGKLPVDDWPALRGRDRL
jgi:hypothetical protein